MKALYGAVAMIVSIAALSHAETPLPDKPIHLTGSVVTPDKKPATDTSVVLIIADQKTHRVIFTKTMQVDQNGAYDITLPPSVFKSAASEKTSFVSYARSPQGVTIETLGGVMTLAPFTRVRLRLIGEDGKPLLHTRISPVFFMKTGRYGFWDSVAGSQWDVLTDLQGYAVFEGLPQGATVRFFINDKRYIAKEDANIALASTDQTPDQTITLIHGGAITGVVRFTGSGKFAAGAAVAAFGIDGRGIGWGQTNLHGRYTISHLPPGSYDVEIDTEERRRNGVDRARWSQWTAAAISPVAVSNGKTSSGVDFTLTHGALISGHVTDQQTGKPVASADITVQGPAHRKIDDYRSTLRTGDDGAYSVRVPAGHQFIKAANHGVPGAPASQSFQVKEGETKQVDFQVISPKPPVTVTVQGVVVGAEGAPVSGAEVDLQGAYLPDPTCTTDAQGKFTFDLNSGRDGVALRARSGALATQSATPAPADGSPVTLRLAANTLCVFQGQVTDREGKPISLVKVSLIHQLNSGFGLPSITVSTDASGKYTFAPNYSDAEYSICAEAPGYARNDTRQTPEAGKTRDVPPLVLAKADSFAGGVVLDPRGKPVANAAVEDMDVTDVKAVTSKDGRFHLSGVPSDVTNINIVAPEGRQALTRISSDRDDNEIRVKSQAEQEEESKHFEALMEADTDKHGDGADAHVLLQAAQTKAAREGKSVLLIFHASWCGGCILLDYFLQDPKIKPIMESRFVIQNLDIWEEGDKKKWENPGAREINTQYGGPNNIPFCVVLDPVGKKLGDSKRNGENMGMPTRPADIQFFLKMFKQAQPDLSDAEILTLRDGLKRHSPL
ncbi:MAG: carboxypeptidase regulatory-like domain-containing protein [Capsulimonas sp.]|uniref:carboxypeptidase regulatory-like domain-containing protein n=1 Tax=Capsulimonas sp. TaxID=2494211 RepID=UPI0032635247